MNQLGIELLSVFGMNPVDQVILAADLGCAHISSGLTQFQVNPHGYAPRSLKDDPALRREMIAAMRDRGVSLSLGEGFAVRPGTDVRDRARELDIMAELGARCLGGVGMEPDGARLIDQFAALVEMAEARGLKVTIEFAPVLPVANLDQALALVAAVNRPDFRVLVDAMHFFRSGGDVAALAALDPNVIGYAQLCDAPLVAVEPDYMREATFERRAPGAGELPLAAFVAALPDHVVISLEVPMLAAAEGGVSPVDRLRPAVEAARRLIETKGEMSC
jgi:sugar phosphate isomerase/epimerase